MGNKIDLVKEQKDFVYDNKKHNVIISAAAGSGKTTVLTLKLVNMLVNENIKENDLSLTNILVMTFTKKATAEMRDRIKKEIENKLLNDKDLTSEARKKLERENALIQNANIVTIDSFCKKIVEDNYTALTKDNSLYYGFDPSYRIADGNEIAVLYEDVLDTLLEDKYQDEEYRDLFDLYTEKTSEDDLRNMLMEGISFLGSITWPTEYIDMQIKEFKQNNMLAYNNCKQVFIESIYNLNDIIEKELNSTEEFLNIYKKCKSDNNIASDTENSNEILVLNAIDILEYYVNNIKKILDTLKEAIQKENTNKDDTEYVLDKNKYNDIVGLIKSTLEKKISKYTRYNILGISKDENDEKKGIVNSLLGHLNEIKNYNYIENASNEIINNEIEKKFLELLKEYYIAVVNEKVSKNIYEVSDYANIALDIMYDKVLKEDNSTCRTISLNAKNYINKFKYIFIDEYQDTNYIQESLLAAVSNNFNSKNVYMVGDVKQSIYRFRKAEPEIFVKKLDDFDKNDIMTLSINFRSSKNIINYVNDLFKKTMTKKYGSIEYSNGHELVPPKDKEEGEKVEIHVLYNEKASEKDNSNTGNDDKKTTDKKTSEDNSINKSNDDKKTTDKKTSENNGTSKSNDDNKTTNDNDSEHKANEIEADYVAKLIKNLHDEKKCEYKDIVILLRGTKSKGKIFTDALTKYKIPSYAEEKKGFFNKLEIRTLMNILTLIDNPMQDIPMTSVMESNIYNFTNNDLAAIKIIFNSRNNDDNKKHNSKLYDNLNYIHRLYEFEINKDNNNISNNNEEDASIENANDDENVDLSKDLETLDKVLNDYSIDKQSFLDKIVCLKNDLDDFSFKSRILKISELIDYIYKKLSIKDIFSTMSNGNLRRGNLEILYKLALSFEKNNSHNLFNFLRYIERIKETDGDKGQAILYDENANVVRVMTLHSSKGLQYKNVFLCGCHTPYNYMDLYENSNCQYDHDYSVALDYFDKSKRCKVATPKKLYILDKKKNEIKQEELRMLYVALTRAKEKLFITGIADNCGGIGYIRSKLDAFMEAYDNNKNVDVDIKDCNSYLDVIMANYPIKNSFCELKIVNHKIQDINDDDENNYDIKSLTKKNDRMKDFENNHKDIFAKYNEKNITSALDNVYEYEDYKRLTAKFSVSDIKNEKNKIYKFIKLKKINDIKDNIYKELDLEKDTKKNNDCTNVKGADLGNIYHRYMQFFDYKNLNYKNPNDNDKNIINIVSKEKIEKFLSTDIGKRMKKAYDNSLYREHKFMALYSQDEIIKFLTNEGISEYSDEFNNINKNVLSDSKIVIQGIIDAFFIDEDKESIVLVDYKTDGMSEGDNSIKADDLKNAYKIQLDLYADALNKLTGYTVKEKIIYSFNNFFILRFR